MENIKIAQILQEMEIIKKEVDELHTIGKNFPNDRSYSTPLKIAIELQINNLLNKRINIMNIEISNPPEFLSQPNKKRNEIQNPTFSVDDLVKKTTDNNTDTKAVDDNKDKTPIQKNENIDNNTNIGQSVAQSQTSKVQISNSEFASTQQNNNDTEFAEKGTANQQPHTDNANNTDNVNIEEQNSAPSKDGDSILSVNNYQDDDFVTKIKNMTDFSFFNQNKEEMFSNELRKVDY